MCNFRRHSDEESGDEDEVEGVIFDNGGDEDMTSSSSDSDTDKEGDNTGAGPSGESSTLRHTCSLRDEDSASSSDDDDKNDKDYNEEDDSDSDDYEVAAAIKKAQRRRNLCPPDVKFRNHITDLSFHPGEDLMAVASVTGDLYLYKYSVEQCELKSTMENHSKACRAVEFSREGDWLVTCGKDSALMITDTRTNTLTQFYDNAHEDIPYSLYVINDNMFSCGDEGGHLKVWDVRSKTATHSFKVGDDQISSMLTNDTGKHLVCSATDCITVYDLFANKLFVQSEAYESELTCLSLLKHDTKLIVGTVKGSMYVFNWGQFGYHSDVLKGPKHSINAALPVTETIVVTANGDANIRACSVFPHQQLGVVGQHQVSVEALDISHDGQWIGSVGFDETARFWDIAYFENMKVKSTKTKKTDLSHNLPSSQARNPGDFFADLS